MANGKNSNGKTQQSLCWSDCLPAGGTVGGETLYSIRCQALDNINPRAKKRTTLSSLTSYVESNGQVVLMTQVQADRVIRLEVEKMLARGEPLDRMMDPWVTAAFLQCAPAIATHLPTSEDSLFQRYGPLIDMETTLELTKMFNLIPGMLGVASGTVTVSHKRQTLYTVSSGKLSIFWTCEDLGKPYLLLFMFLLHYHSYNNRFYLFLSISKHRIF